MPHLPEIHSSLNPPTFTMQPKSRSQPIPIIRDEAKRDYVEEDSGKFMSKYDMATWNMYLLITNARRLREKSRQLDAASEFIESSSAIHISQPSSPEPGLDTTSQGYISPGSGVQQPPLDECHCDVFAVDI